jgi:hypothetical protein
MGREMNKKKLLSVALVGIVLLFFWVGCQPNKSTLGEPPVPMNTVTQNSDVDLVTFEFQLPKGWISAPQYTLTVVGCPKDSIEKVFKAGEDVLPITIGIGNYYYSGLVLSEKDKQMYKDLFAGKTNAYEERMKRPIASAADFDMPSSFKDYLDPLLPKKDDSSQTSNAANTPKIDFQYRHYDGTNGKITEVQYSYTYNGKKTHIIQCYREDIPYLITGAFDDSVDLSSGKIAPWVASSLKVTEHFTIKDNVLQKED